MLVEHVRALVAGGAPFVYAYYPGVDEVAHAFGLDGAFYPAELAATDRLVGDVLDALPDDVALLVTADHGQVQVGPDGWRALAPLHSLVETYAGDGRFRLPARASPGAPPSSTRPRRSSCGGDAWVFRREQLLDEGWLGPRPGARDLPARSATSCSRPEARSGSSIPRFPTRRGLRRRHGSITAAEIEVPLVASRREHAR